MPCLKGPGCDGCPAKHWGKYMVPDEYVEGAEVLVLSQNPGADEEAGRKLTGYDGPMRKYEPHPPAPLIGVTGYQAERQYFPLAGLERGKVSLANPIRCRMYDSNDLPRIDQTLAKQIVEHCQRAYYRPPSSTRLVLAEGAYALYAATGEDGSEPAKFQSGHQAASRGIDGWRGWVLPWNPPPRPRVTQRLIYQPSSTEIAVLATYHLSFLNHAPWYKPVVARDWTKVPKVLAGTWPEPFPEIQAMPPVSWPQRYAFDTEFYGSTLTRYSMALRDATGKPTVWVVEAGDHQVPQQAPAQQTAIFHSVEADLAFLSTLLGPHVVTLEIEDAMYLHAVLWADLDHNLDFTGSIYSRTNRWKHLVQTNPRLYSGGDALGTWDSFQGMLPELRRDPRVEHVYRELQMPLAMIIHKARTYGLRVLPERARAALRVMETQQRDAQLRAQAYAGWPINVGAPLQIARHLFQVEEVHVNPISGRRRR